MRSGRSPMPTRIRPVSAYRPACAYSKNRMLRETLGPARARSRTEQAGCYEPIRRRRDGTVTRRWLRRAGPERAGTTAMCRDGKVALFIVTVVQSGYRTRRFATTHCKGGVDSLRGSSFNPRCHAQMRTPVRSRVNESAWSSRAGPSGPTRHALGTTAQPTRWGIFRRPTGPCMGRIPGYPVRRADSS
jgi:hypothetical protein